MAPMRFELILNILKGYCFTVKLWNQNYKRERSVWSLGWRLVSQSQISHQLKNFLYDRVRFTLTETSLYTRDEIRTRKACANGFSYHYNFHYQNKSVCGLDFTFIIAFLLQMSCVKSLHVPNFLGFARYSHLTGFTEFTGFYLKISL